MNIAMYRIALLCVLCLLSELVRSQISERPIEQDLQQALERTRGIAVARSNAPIVVDGGRAVLTEFDIAIPLPCRSSEAVVPVTAADGPVGDPTEPPSAASPTAVRVQAPPTGAASNCDNIARNTANLAVQWGDGSSVVEVPFTYDTPTLFSSTEKSKIDEAIAEYDRFTCIKIIPRTTENDYINLIKDGGCWSYIGKVNLNNEDGTGRQPISLSNGCISTKRTPIHEFFHALGSWHQQSRPDRDNNITLVVENIQSNRISQFDKKTDVNTHDTPYSYYSVMHYSQYAFSVQYGVKKTILTNDPFYQDLIGTIGTFSFEDLQVINRYYQCDRDCNPRANPCREDEYRGKDCQCYCRGTGADYPSKVCVRDGPCDTVNKECACTAAKCAGLAGTVCNPSSKACECDTANGFELHRGECVNPNSLTCDGPNKACYCSLKQPGACDGVPGSTCDNPSGECRCTVGGDGLCLGSSGCTKPGEECGCSANEPGACSRVANSHCDDTTNACECNEDYSIRGQVCTKAPGCSRIGRSCLCSVQGADACNRMRNAHCNPSSNACECLPLHSGGGRRCRRTCDPAHMSNGNMVSPFTNKRPNLFVRNKGDEPSAADMFGLRSNGYRLQASGRGSGNEAVILSPRLTKDRNIRDVSICVNFNLKMKNAEFRIEYRTKRSTEWRTISHSNEGPALWGIPITERLDTTGKLRHIQIRFSARMSSNLAVSTDWEVNVDPLIVVDCACLP